MVRLIPLLLMAFLTIPAAADLRIEVDLSDRLLSVIENDEILRTYQVSVGKDEKPTPTGTFKISKVVWNPSWRPPDEEWARAKTPKGPKDPDNPMKRVKIFFREPDYYIHGTDDEASLGRARSHGCVRMNVDDVTEVAKLVMEHGGEPRPEPWYRRILRFRRTTVIYLDNPATMRVRE